MPIRHHLGQLFMVGIPDPTLTSETRAQLQELHPGGVILFKRNYRNLDTLAALCEEVHALLPDQPPLIALDHEGGRVHRLAPPFTHFPPAAKIGLTGSATLAQQIGQAMGAELSSIGIDLDFAPVLDVHTNPANTVIGDRAFASDPQLAGIFGCAQARGLRAGGVIPCGKHFPGHGATFMDSHHDLPHDARSQEDIEKADLQPFRMAIAEEIEMLITAHVVYPALDPDFPATLSQRIITDILREQLGFRGVVITDDLEMGAIMRHGGVERAAVQALQAGADMLLVCHQLDLALRARDTCLTALDAGELAPTRIEEARQRISILKQRHAQQRRAGREMIGAAAHRQLAGAVA